MELLTRYAVWVLNVVRHTLATALCRIKILLRATFIWIEGLEVVTRVKELII